VALSPLGWQQRRLKSGRFSGIVGDVALSPLGWQQSRLKSGRFSGIVNTGNTVFSFPSGVVETLSAFISPFA